MGRPAADIDLKKLKGLMRLRPSLEDTAAFFECSDRTIERFIQKEFEQTFVEFRDTHMVHTKMRLIKKAIDKAEAGDNVMLKFCLENLCNWSSNPTDNSGQKPLTIKLAYEEPK